MPICAAAIFALLLLPDLATAWSGVVTRVLDGDSLIVLRDGTGQSEQVRLYGIDCPEYGQAHNKKAAAMTRRKTLHRRVEIEDLGKDQYQRTLAGLVRLEDGGVLQETLLKAGLAWVYRRYCKDCQAWIDLEAEARAAKRGLWRDNNPIPPWRYRHEKKPD